LESTEVLLIDAANVLKTIGLRGSFSKTLKWLVSRILQNPNFYDIVVEVVVDNAGDHQTPRRTVRKNGRFLEIVSCNGNENGQYISADHYIRDFIGSNKHYEIVDVVTDDKELIVSILNETYKGGFDIKFTNVKSFIKKI